MAQAGLHQRIRDTVEQSFERWDGRGVPKGLKGDEILVPSRLVNLADVVEVFHRSGGVQVARDRAGTQFDPGLVDVFASAAEALFAEIDAAPAWETVVTSGLGSRYWLSGIELDSALEAVANFTDVKSPCTIGHSTGVASLVRAAASPYGLTNPEAKLASHAALVHDLGQFGVSNTIWDKQGHLSPWELERVRLHTYLTERMLASSSGLAPLAAVAVQHHERLDGSGYPRGLAGEDITPAGRLLAAADSYHARLEPRPHRPELAPEEAASDLRAEVRAGRLDGDAVAAVLGAAGHRARKRRDWPAGLTAREVDVLRLLARVLSNKQIAARVTISAKTASTHVEHIYTKLGVTNRAMASLFAAKHGLITAGEVDFAKIGRTPDAPRPLPSGQSFNYRRRSTREVSSVFIAIACAVSLYPSLRAIARRDRSRSDQPPAKQTGEHDSRRAMLRDRAPGARSIRAGWFGAGGAVAEPVRGGLLS